MAAALLDAGRADGAGFVDDHQNADFSLQAAGDGFGRIELVGVVQLFQMLAYRLRPGFDRRRGLGSRFWQWLRRAFGVGRGDGLG